MYNVANEFWLLTLLKMPRRHRRLLSNSSFEIFLKQFLNKMGKKSLENCFILIAEQTVETKLIVGDEDELTRLSRQVLSRNCLSSRQR